MTQDDALDDRLLDYADKLAQRGDMDGYALVQAGALALRRSTLTLDELVAEAAENERLAYAPVRRAGLRVLEGGRT